jgi:hypothetical protein
MYSMPRTTRSTRLLAPIKSLILDYHTLLLSRMCCLRFKLATCRGTTAGQLETTVYMLVIEQAHGVTCSQEQSIPLLSIASRIVLKRYYTRLLINTRLLIRSMERSTVQDSKGCHSELRHKTHCRKCSSVSSRHRISPVPFAGRWTHHRLKRSDVKYC